MGKTGPCQAPMSEKGPVVLGFLEQAKLDRPIYFVPRGPGATQPVRAYCHFADPPARARAAGRCSAVLNPIGATRVREASFWLGASRIAEDGGCGRPLAATSRVMVRERAPPLRRLVRKVGLASPPRSDHRVRGRPCSA